MGSFRIFIRAFASAQQSVRALQWKSWVFILTILFGSMGIAATFSIGQNMDGYVDRLINENGGPTVTLFNTSPKLKFSSSDLQKFANISVVKEAYLVDTGNLAIRSGSAATNLRIIPVTAENSRHLQLKMRSGTMIAPLEGARAPAQVVLSSTAVKALNAPIRIGDTVAAKAKGGDEIRLRVIGIADATDGLFDPGTVWSSFPVYRTLTGKNSLGSIRVVAKEPKDMNWIESFSQLAMKDKFDTNVFVSNPLGFFMDQKHQLEVFISMGYYLGLIALIAGSIGSTSVMLLNIGIRRREIGLYKAIGFSSDIVLVQILCEALILSLIGGVLGGLAGSALGYYISLNMFSVASLSVSGFSIGMTSALVVGLVFGLLPAFAAARMDPVKALQG